MKALPITLSTLGLLALAAPALAGPNDYFGSGMDPTSSSPASTAINAASSAAANAGPSDYSVDEKRMQRKYKENVRSAEKLIAKGEAMMKARDDKTSKKGKIFKEIGERRLAELKANNPFPEVAEKPGKSTQ